eukprot:TRINITY_DN34254_c0_g1_i1.p1 TRINITY_DN34254_c0_g1~~TRINITY_DN34254_c0_g1_i1.p1  ORF type:complete len:137 (+),score=44.50 TRINITY_DN34254_c0_g1_i1:279-689(+)
MMNAPEAQDPVTSKSRQSELIAYEQSLAARAAMRAAISNHTGMDAIPPTDGQIQTFRDSLAHALTQRTLEEATSKQASEDARRRLDTTFTLNPVFKATPNNSNGTNLSLIHISEPTRLLSISYAVFCLKKKTAVTL